MRIFKQGNWEGIRNVCPICNTNKQGEVVLIAIDDKVEGNNCEAIQVHLDCLDLWYDEKLNIIYQNLEEKN